MPSRILCLCLLLIGLAPALWAQGRHDGSLILLREQADLRAAAQMGDKSQRGAYVAATLQAHAARSQARLQAWLGQRGLAYRSYWLGNLLHVGAETAELASLRDWPEVAAIVPNAIVGADLPQAGPGLRGPLAGEITWGLRRIGVPEVWALGITGRGVVIGGQDTGYEWSHPAIAGRYRGRTGTHDYNWFDAIRYNLADSVPNPCGFGLAEPCDDNGHGTHTMGTALGGTDSLAIGVAPGAEWIGARNMERGFGTLANYVACFQWFVAPTDMQGQRPDPSKAPHVVINSWACPEEEGCLPDNFGVMQVAVEQAKAAGIFVAVAAGNDGAGCESVRHPAAIFEASFSVGATDSLDQIAVFSGRGPVSADGSWRLKPNVTAPGVRVLSAIRGGRYAYFNGTSMAAPHVAGVVALMIEANPALAGRVEVLEDILEQTALPLFNDQDCIGYAWYAHPNAVFGYGRIDALAAVRRAQQWPFGEAEVAAPQLSIFPNPSGAADAAYAAWQGLEGDYLELWDIAGRLLWQQRLSRQSPQRLPDVPAGLYVLRLRAGERSATARWVRH